MSTYDEVIAGLQTKLAARSGPERRNVLRELAAAHIGRYRLSPGNPAGLPDLTAAIDAWREIYTGLESDDPQRHPYAGVLGLYLTVRDRAHTRSSVDREQAIGFLEEALSYPQQSPTALAMYRFSLAQYYLIETMNQFDAAQRGGSAFRTGASPESRAVARRTVELLRLADEELGGANEQLASAVTPLLTTAQAWWDLLESLGNGFGDIDFPRMARAMAAVQQLNNDVLSGPGGLPAGPTGAGPAHTAGGHLADPWPSVADLLSQVSPRDFPTLVVRGEVDDGPLTAPPAQPMPVAAVDLTALRRELLATLTGAAAVAPAEAEPTAAGPVQDEAGLLPDEAGTTQDDAVAELLASLWHADGPLPATTVIDRAVALATTLVGEGEPEPAVAAVDRLLLATTLLLRDRDDDGGGWGETLRSGDVHAGTDLRGAAGHLLAATAGLPCGHPVAALVPQALGVLLDRCDSLPGVLGSADPMPVVDADPATDPAADPAAVPPPVGAVAAATRDLGADLLVQLCLLPAGARPGVPRVGLLLLHPQPARVDLVGPVPLPGRPDGLPGGEFGACLRAALGERTAPGRVLLVVPDELARHAWSAVRDEAGRHLVADLTMSYVASGRQVIELAGRRQLPATRTPVFVANPRGDREWASVEAMELRRMFHPRSVGLGRVVEQSDGVGTPAELLAWLPGPDGPGAGLLQLDCGLVDVPAGDGVGSAPALELGTAEEPAELTAESIRQQGRRRPVGSPGGVAVLPAAANPGAAIRLADALLAAGLTGVIGWSWPVPQPVAALMLVVLHGKLIDERLPAAEAVTAVRRWMLDPDRRGPVAGAAGHAATMAGTDLADPVFWAAVWHRGSMRVPDESER